MKHFCMEDEFFTFKVFGFENWCARKNIHDIKLFYILSVEYLFFNKKLVFIRFNTSTFCIGQQENS